MDNINLRNEEVQDILGVTPNWMIRWGNVVIILIIILFIYFSYLVEYPDIIQAKAEIMLETPPQHIVVPTEGKIDTILVDHDQRINPGHPVAILENDANFSDIFRLKSFLDTLQIVPGQDLVQLSSFLSMELGEVYPEYLNFIKNYRQYLFNQRLKEFDKNSVNNRTTLKELQKRLNALQTQYQSLMSTENLRETELEHPERLFRNNMTSIQDFEKVRFGFLKEKQTFYNLIVSLLETEGKIRALLLQLESTTNVIDREENLVYGTMKQSLGQLKKAIKNWEEKYVLKADIAGEFFLLRHCVGNRSINNGEVLFSIIPLEESNVYAQLEAPALNFGKVKLGQTVNISVLSFQHDEYGFLKGRIEHVRNSSKDGFYIVNVSLPEKGRTSYGKNIPLTHGMVGTAKIVTENSRLLERIFHQVKGVF